MSNWISTKLKVAESFLQQIDQQAAESLGKGERSRPEVVDGHGAPARPESVPLKEQLKTRTPAPDRNGAHWDSSSRVSRVSAPAAASSRAVVRPDLAADNSWTELLSSSNSMNSIPPAGRAVGDFKVFRSHKDRNKNEIGVFGPGKNRRNAGIVVPKSTLKPSTITERKAISKEKSGIDKNVNDEVGFSGRTERSATPVEDRNGYGNGDNMPHEANEVPLTKEVANEGKEPPLGETAIRFDWRSAISGGDGISTSNGQTDGVRMVDAIGEDEQRNYERGNSSDSDRGSDSESNSGATSDSEDEVERRRRAEQILAEERAARALEALHERENVVARLEGEKLSLEKILEEREKRQAQEASELQLSTIETMDAVELEKQKLDSTRMEALSRLIKLETTNAELAKSLAATQWNLEIEVIRVAELRQQLEYKEMTLQEIRSGISRSSPNLTSLEQSEESKQDKLERALLEADYYFTCDKITHLQEKAKALTKDIETTQREIEDPTQVEIELKKRLTQLTDPLIQKQAQVEALASEKATLAFRIETVTRLIDEEMAAEQLTNADDVEARAWKPLNSKLKPVFRRKIRTGGQQLWSILSQLDSIFFAGSMYIRRDPKAQIWSLVYLVCLHLWVLYIFTSHSQVSDNNRSGAVISLDSINKTTGR